MRVLTNIVAADLFCGVGGLTTGLERSGIDVRLAVDVDEDCRHPIQENTKAEFMKADVAEMSTSEIQRRYDEGEDDVITLLAGCAPCQPFSTYSRAAKRAGGPRRGRGKRDDWKLVERFGEIVKDIKPDLVTMENVPPLADQEVFGILLDKLEGYWIDHAVVQCRTVGLPQTRKRLVLLASRLGPIAVPKFDRPSKTVRQTIEALPKISAGEIDLADPLHRASRLSEINATRIRASTPGGTWRDWPEALRAACHTKESGATYPAVYGRMEWDAPSPTITTQCFGYGNGRFGHPEQHRAISLREAAMLQGFPREYSFVPADEHISFARLGRLIGNAVPVTLGEAIGKVLVDHVRLHRGSRHGASAASEPVC